MNIEEFLSQEQLPSVPAVAMRILKLVDDPGSSSEDLAKEIRTDPAMSCQILRMANSARLSPNREVQSVELAVSMLGRATVASTALTFSLSQHVEKDGEFREQFDAYWKSTVLQAVCAELLAGKDRVKAAEYFLIGLMADIGRLAMLCILKGRYVEIIRSADLHQESLHEAEKRVLGFSHPTVSCRLAQQWGLPAQLVSAIQRQHADVMEILEAPGVKAIDAVAPIASHIADMFNECAAPNAIISVDGIAGHFFGVSAEELLQATRTRAEEMGQMFNIEANTLVPVVDIMANANRQLAKLLMQVTADSGAAGQSGAHGASGAHGQAPAVTEPVKVAASGENTGTGKYSLKARAVLSNDDFDECASMYVQKCLDTDGCVGLLLVQCHTSDICADLSEEDRFVRNVRESLRSHLRPDDLVTRFDGNYICVLCRLEKTWELATIAERAQKVLVEKFGRPSLSPTSIGGIAVDRDCKATLTQLQQLAYFRLDKARVSGTSGIDIAVFGSDGLLPHSPNLTLV